MGMILLIFTIIITILLFSILSVSKNIKSNKKLKNILGWIFGISFVLSSFLLLEYSGHMWQNEFFSVFDGPTFLPDGFFDSKLINTFTFAIFGIIALVSFACTIKYRNNKKSDSYKISFIIMVYSVVLALMFW